MDVNYTFGITLILFSVHIFWTPSYQAIWYTRNK